MAAVFACAPLIQAETQSSPALRQKPAGEELGLYQVATISCKADDELSGWRLAYRLRNGAEGAGLALKRSHWGSVARAFASTGETPDGQVEAHRIGERELLIEKKTAEDGSVTATLYVPSGLIMPEHGNTTAKLETNFQRTRNTTQELTTWPLALTLEHVSEFEEDRSFELSASYGHTWISRKTRPAFRDEEGEIISFRGIDSVTIQDSRNAALDAAYLFMLSPETRLGRVDAAIVAGGTWERDEINLLDQRVMPYAGIELRMTSLTKDDLSLELALEMAGVFERYIITDPIVDESGEVVGMEREIEEFRLPSLMGRVGLKVPLYRLDDVTLIAGEAKASLLQALQQSGSDGEEGRERLGEASLSISFVTPFGASIRMQQKLNWLRPPGEASSRIESFQWDSIVTASMTVKF